MIGRRSFITGLVSLVAAPAIVRAGSLMPVKVMLAPYDNLNFIERRLLAEQWGDGFKQNLALTEQLFTAAESEKIEAVLRWRSPACIAGASEFIKKYGRDIL